MITTTEKAEAFLTACGYTRDQDSMGDKFDSLVVILRGFGTCIEKEVRQRISTGLDPVVEIVADPIDYLLSEHNLSDCAEKMIDETSDELDALDVLVVQTKPKKSRSNQEKKWTDRDLETLAICCWNAARDRIFPPQIRTVEDLQLYVTPPPYQPNVEFYFSTLINSTFRYSWSHNWFDEWVLHFAADRDSTYERSSNVSHGNPIL